MLLYESVGILHTVGYAYSMNPTATIKLEVSIGQAGQLQARAHTSASDQYRDLDLNPDHNPYVKGGL